LSILESCCLRPMMRNSVLEELRVRRFADIQEEIVSLESAVSYPTGVWGGASAEIKFGAF